MRLSTGFFSVYIGFWKLFSHAGCPKSSSLRVFIAMLKKVSKSYAYIGCPKVCYNTGPLKFTPTQGVQRNALTGYPYSFAHIDFPKLFSHRVFKVFSNKILKAILIQGVQLYWYDHIGSPILCSNEVSKAIQVILNLFV